MKNIILTTVVSLIAISNLSAQFDDRFYFPSKEWKPISGLQFEEINFTIEGDTLNTILFKTDSFPKATILFYHGASGNISLNTGFVKLLVKNSYQVFMVDFRGYGKSTGTPTHINIANDAQIIFDSIVTRKEFKHYPIIVYGASMGTQIATKITKDNQDEISGLILDGVIGSFTDMALLSAPKEQKEVISQYVTSPYSAKEDIKFIKSIPKLFIHSKEDSAVPFSQCDLVYLNAIEPKVLWIYTGEHLEASNKYQDKYIQNINSLYELNHQGNNKR